MEPLTRARRRCVRAAVLIGLCLGAAQCDNSPDSPSEEFLSGIWTGTLENSISGPATARVTITQVGSSLTGTWSVDATNVAGANGGSLFGRVTRDIVSFELTPSDRLNCFFSVTARVTDGNTITGIYDTFNCTVVPSGIISLTKATIAFG